MSDTGIELYPEYQYTERDEFVDRCYLYAAIGMLAGLFASFLRG